MTKSAQTSAMRRINELLDDNSFVEVGAYMTARSTDFNMQAQETPADGVVTGYGTVEGALVYVYSQDAAVMGGSVGEMHAKKIENLYGMAMKMGAPVVGLIDCAGLRLQEGLDALNGFGRLYGCQTLASGVIPQIINLLCMNKHEANVKLADLVIRPDMKGYTAASFSARSIDSLLARGKVAALQQWSEITRVKELIGESGNVDNEIPKARQPEKIAIRNVIIRGLSPREEGWVRRKMRIEANSEITLNDIHREIAILYGTKAFVAVNYRLLGTAPYDLELSLKSNPMSTLNIGFRFDSEDMAAILLNTTLNNRSLRGSQLALTGRLSKNPYVKLEYSLENTFLRGFNLAYMFRYNNVDYYRKGKKTNNVTYRYHAGELGLSSLYLRNFKFKVGLRYEYFDYNSLLFSNEDEVMSVRPEGFFSYYGVAELDTYDRRFYPSRGVSLEAAYSLYTDNLATYDGGSPFSALSVRFCPVVSLSDRLKLLPSAFGRVLIGHDPAYSYFNNLGGTEFGRYNTQQMPFVGINHVEVFENAVIVGKLEFRQRMGRKHYLSVIGNYALQDDNFFDLFGRKGIWGGGIGYSRDSMLGPIDLVFTFSDWSEKLGCYFNLGFYF